MFGFGRRERIRRRAAELGKLLHRLVSCLETQSFDEFVEARLNEGMLESYTDRPEQKFGFFESGSREGEFSFHVRYHPDDTERIIGPDLGVTGHYDYLGLMISGSKLEYGISVDLSEIIQMGISGSKLGRDAKALKAELLKFPGFNCYADLRALWRG